MYKTFRFDFKKWPEVNSFHLSNDLVISKPCYKMHTHLRAFYGAPAWTFEELKLFEEALNKIGITVGAYPCDSELLTPEEIQRRGGIQNILLPELATSKNVQEVQYSEIQSNPQIPSIKYQLADDQLFRYVVEYLEKDRQQKYEGLMFNSFWFNLPQIIMDYQNNSLFTAFIENELVGYATFERSEKKHGGITQIYLKVDILEIVPKYRRLHQVTQLLENLVIFLNNRFPQQPRIRRVHIVGPLKDQEAYWEGLIQHTELKLVIQ